MRARGSAGLPGSICLGPARECGKRASLRLCTQRMQANLSAICYAIEFCIWLTAVDYDGSDPNGIRTRVTAVKGRCPRPLDDRVSERQISRRRPALQVAFLSNGRDGKSQAIPIPNRSLRTLRHGSAARRSLALPRHRCKNFIGKATLCGATTKQIRAAGSQKFFQ